MLKSLSIRDFVIVERLSLEFEPGFTALTGETGAGKSILLDALALALGDRADPQAIREGAERAEIEVEFDISAMPVLAQQLAAEALDGDPGVLILRRVMDRGGRSRAFINGRASTLTALRDLGERLVDIHGQHEHQRLLRPEVQREVLDAQGGHEALVDAVEAAWREWQRWREAREAFAREQATRVAERDQLVWQVDELQRLDPQAGEWDEVQQEQSRLAHAASLIEGAEQAVSAISEDEGAALERVGTVAASLRPLADIDATLAPLVELLDGAEAQLQEAVHGLRRYRDRVDLDPERLRSVEQRLEALHGTARKLRTRPDELPALRERLSARLAELETLGDEAAMAAREAAAAEAWREAATRLSAARRKAAQKLSREVSAAMADLSLGVARFEVALEPIEGGSAHGAERIEFLIATNAGSPPRSLARVASGGELSRVSLAIQVITSNRSAVPTLIFDEVDAGIGGAVAEQVGRKLAALGEGRQVLCVTHLAQVAAQAAHQWTVAKAVERGVTRSTVQVLDASARVEEIARMLGGTSITATTRRHAAEMLGGGKGGRQGR
jgi:DNA repair protein RecN (Recombination protein N)